MSEEDPEHDWKMIIHDKCGLPVEFCKCPDARVTYNWEDDTFNIDEEE